MESLRIYEGLITGFLKDFRGGVTNMPLPCPKSRNALADHAPALFHYALALGQFQCALGHIASAGRFRECALVLPYSTSNVP